MTTLSTYNNAVQELEGEVRDLERQSGEIEARLVALRGVIAGLRDLSNGKLRVVGAAVPEAEQPYRQPLALEPEPTLTRYQKGDIIKLVLDAIATQSGLRSGALADLLKDKVTSGAQDKRKLILNAISYLASGKKPRIEKDDHGGWRIVE